MRFSNSVLTKLEDAKVEVFYADRGMTKFWNERRGRRELRFFTGYYWYLRSRANKALTAEHGPFRSRMAAYRDGFYQMQLRVD